jgi:hypothetical protein
MMTDTPTQDSDKNPQADSHKALNPPAKPARDGWAKFEILTRPLAAFLTAMTIAAIGFFGQQTITAISLQEQNARLYTELLARREDAESSLRKDMFKEIMSGFFNFVDSSDIQNDLSKKVLKLELLAINFGDTLSLGPLFSEMSKDIERIMESNSDEVDDWKNVAGEYQNRLRSLAKRVASAQLSTVSPSGVPISFAVPIKLIETDPNGTASQDWPYTWPYDDPTANSNLIELDGVKRIFDIKFRNADFANRSVQVNLVIMEFVTQVSTEANAKGEFETFETTETVTDLKFTLDFFNFPLIDNSRLSNNQRFALIIEQFDTNTIIFTGMVFPGLYASQRDKPFLNEAIQELGDQQKQINPDPGDSD